MSQNLQSRNKLSKSYEKVERYNNEIRNDKNPEKNGGSALDFRQLSREFGKIETSKVKNG